MAKMKRDEEAEKREMEEARRVFVEEFSADVKACREFAKEVLGQEISAEETFVFYDAIGAPADLSASEREQVKKDIQTARTLAEEFFRTHSPKEVFQVFSIFTVEVEEDLLDRPNAFRVAVAQARAIFGDGVMLATALEIFDRLYVVDEEEEEDPEEDSEE